MLQHDTARGNSRARGSGTDYQDKKEGCLN